MLFKTKNGRSDSKDRFQKKNFRSHLQQAQNYKRSVRSFPKTKFRAFFFKIRLGSYKTVVPAVIILLLTAYLIYIPNFLHVKNVEISGLRTEDMATAINTVNGYLKTRFWWPQKNMLLLSKAGLSKYLLAHDGAVAGIKHIKKDLPDTIILELEQRYGKYELEIGDWHYILSNDGVVMSGQYGTSTISSLPLIRFQDEQQPADGERFFSPELLGLAEGLSSGLAKDIKIPTGTIFMENRKSADVKVFTANGYEFFFDVKSDICDTSKKLQLLLSRLTDAEKAKLKYIDMRIKDKGYVCLKDAPCAKETAPPQATSTEASTDSLQ